MAKVPNSSTSSSREAGTGSVRRKLLTVRASTQGPPRVVLHLPDLDALESVSVGSPKRSRRRRFDEAHAAPVAAPHRQRQDADDESGGDARHLVRNILGHVEKLSGRAVTGGSTLVQIAALLQKPKVMVAGIAAIGLQLAALLAIFLGENKSTVDGSPNDARTANRTSPIADNLPPNLGTDSIGGVHTPLSMPPELLYSQGGSPLSFGSGANSALPHSSSSQTPSPTIVAQPKLPPIPTLNTGELPPWDSHEKFSMPPGTQLAAPTATPSGPSTNGSLSTNSSRTGSAEPATPNGASLATESSRNAPSAVGSQSLLSLPTMPVSDGAKSTPAVPVSQPGSGRPKARLNGTILKVPSGGGST